MHTMDTFVQVVRMLGPLSSVYEIHQVKDGDLGNPHSTCLDVHIYALTQYIIRSKTQENNSTTKHSHAC